MLHVSSCCTFVLLLFWDTESDSKVTRGHWPQSGLKVTQKWPESDSKAAQKWPLSYFWVTFRSFGVDAPESLLSHFLYPEMIWGFGGSRAGSQPRPWPSFCKSQGKPRRHFSVNSPALIFSKSSSIPWLTSARKSTTNRKQRAKLG